MAVGGMLRKSHKDEVAGSPRDGHELMGKEEFDNELESEWKE